MCGISGIHNKKSWLDINFPVTLSQAIAHRGPDDEGFLAINTHTLYAKPLVSTDSKIEGVDIRNVDFDLDLVLGHRRLAIIDVSPLGHQPMANQDRSLWVIFNGEIYNYLALRKELEQQNYHFISGSDTEIILAAYDYWGEKCVERFNGMWSFVIYDTKKRLLFGSRDRFGVKPFYYFNSDEYFVFASEIKALLKLPFIQTIAHRKLIAHYLIDGILEYDTETMFKDIFELWPGNSFVYDLKSKDLRIWEYYKLESNSAWETFDESKLKDHIKNVRELLSKAVELRLQSDVAVGSCLSGGIDSSSVVCLINDLLKQKSYTQVGSMQKVFTATYANDSVDETKWAQIVVNNTKTEWYQTKPQASELIGDLSDLIYTQDLPFGSTSIYSQYRVMKLVAENGVKVLLDGQGADELFGGYNPIFTTYFMQMIANKQWDLLLSEFKSLNNSPVNQKVLLIKVAMSLSGKYMPILKNIFGNNNLLLNKYIQSKQYFNDRYVRSDNNENINLKLNEEFTRYSLKQLLRYEDRNSMRFSIEARAPFSDDINLINYINSIPSSYKIHRGWSKYILREAVKGIIPEEIRLRTDKVGFATPEYRWLKENKMSLIERIKSSQNHYFNIDKVVQDWDKMLANSVSRGLLWRIINYNLWKDVFNVAE